MEKKEYIKPEISIIEMLENTSILAGSPRDQLNYNLEDDDNKFLNEGDGGEGWGNDGDTDYWE